MERARSHAAIIGNFDWSDMGNWEALYNSIEGNNVVVLGDSISSEKIVIQEVIKGKSILIMAKNKAFLVCDKTLDRKIILM